MTGANAFLTIVLVFFMAGQDVGDGRVWINVLVNGKPVMSFVPADTEADRDSRGVFSAVDQPAKTRNGEQIKAFHLSGWKEGDAYRIMITACVPARTRSDASSSCSENSDLKSVEFVSLRIRAGQQVTIPRMKEAGMTPWSLRAGRKETL